MQTFSSVPEGFKNALQFRDETRSNNSLKKLATPEGNSQLDSNFPDSKAPENSASVRAPALRASPQILPVSRKKTVDGLFRGKETRQEDFEGSPSQSRISPSIQRMLRLVFTIHCVRTEDGAAVGGVAFDSFRAGWLAAAGAKWEQVERF